MSESTEPWPTLNEPTLDPMPDTVVAPAPPPQYYAPPEATGPPPPDRRIGAGMLLGILAVLIAAVGVLLAWYLGHRSQTNEVTTIVTASTAVTHAAARAGVVSVPRVIGLTERQALGRLTGAGFASKVIVEQSTEPAGTVVSQSPAGAVQVAKGATVQILVSRPATSETATTAATTTAAETTSPTTTEAPPTPRTAQVPDVSGATEAGAAHTLVDAGVRPSFVFVPSGQALGTVVGQAKQSGATVPYDAHMQVNLSQGPNMQTEVAVPSVIGKTLTDSVSTLNAAGLRLIYVKEPVRSRAQAGKVVQQSPGEGARVPRNAQVLVFVAAYTAGQ